MLAGIYLVSACGSAEEFVAAFRRYADRTGLFVPAASPLPQGRKGRITLTLKDGGVMLEGEAEVMQSSAKSPLHGRAGMILKFVELDEPSKTVLVELEKARLAMKPAAPSVAPRPADAALPSEPRPIIPAVGGRIDAANALAECVVIGDLGALEEVAGGPPKAGPKFVVPSIPAFGARPKAATTPPEGIKPDAPKADATRMTTMGMPALRPPGEASGPAKTDPAAVPSTPARDSAAMDLDWDEPAAKSGPVAAPATAAKSGPIAAPPAASAKSEAAKAAAKSRMTQLGFPVVKPPADSGPKATTLGMVPLRATGAPAAGAPAPPKLPEGSSSASVPAPPKLPDASSPASVPAPPKLPDASSPGGMKPPLPQPTPTRSKSPTAPPRQPTPFAPLPVAKLPAKPAPVLADAEIDEKTDLTTTPLEPDSAFIESRPPPADGEPERKPQRSGGMRASEIMAAVHAEDWTMAPDASGPTVLGADKAAMPEVPEPTPSPGAPPTGDWTMSLDPAAGWSPPEKLAPPSTAEKPTKIEKRAPVLQTPGTGNPVKAVSSDRPIDIQAWEDKPTSIGAKIEIDATLMEPLDPMPAIDEEPVAGMTAASSGGMGSFPLAGSTPGMPMMVPAFAPPAAPDAPPPLVPNATGPETSVTESLLHAALPLPPPPGAPMPPPGAPMPPPGAPMPQEIPIGYAPTLLPGQLAAPPFQYATSQPGDVYRGEPSPIAPRSTKKLLVIVATALVILLAVVLAMTLGGKKKHPADAQHAGSGAAIVAAVVSADTHGSDASSAQDAGSAKEPGSATRQVVTPPPPPKAEKCSVEVATRPEGAEVSLEDKTVLGTTPGTFALPCGTTAKLKIQKPKYVGVVRQVTPTAAGTKVVVALGQITFLVRITSTPAGASITVAGRSKGVTPAAVQLPAFQISTITLSKPGYSSHSEKVMIKANGQSHHFALKRAGRATRRSESSHGLNGI